jgi:hypothetical protein
MFSIYNDTLDEYTEHANVKEEAIFKRTVNAAETNEGKLPFKFFRVVSVEGSFVCGWLGDSC